MQTVPVQLQHQRVFQPELPIWRRLFLYFLPVFWVARLIDEAWKHNLWPVAFYAALLATSVVTLLLYSTARLVIAPDGVTNTFLGGTLYASWDDVGHIQEERRWYGRNIKIVLRHWQSQAAPWVRWLPWWPKPIIVLIAGGIVVWRPDVFEALYDHAPWLFEDAPVARG